MAYLNQFYHACAWLGFGYFIALMCVLLVLPYYALKSWAANRRSEALKERQWLGILTGMIYGDEWPKLMPRTFQLTAHYRKTLLELQSNPKPKTSHGYVID